MGQGERGRETERKVRRSRERETMRRKEGPSVVEWVGGCERDLWLGRVDLIDAQRWGQSEDMTRIHCVRLVLL